MNKANQEIVEAIGEIDNWQTKISEMQEDEKGKEIAGMLEDLKEEMENFKFGHLREFHIVHPELCRLNNAFEKSCDCEEKTGETHRV